MQVAYQYRLKVTYEQRRLMSGWLDLLRRQYNWLLADRFDWWEHNRCPVNACPLACSIAQPREKPDYYSQKRSLVQLKQERPWYGEIQSQVLQDMVKRVKQAFDRFIKGDKNGKRSGKPRFKGKNRYRTFTYPQASLNWVNGNRVKLPKIGWVRFVRHRLLPDGFSVKTVSISRKADGWYVTFSLEDKSVPDLPIVEIEPTEANSIGVDAGVEYFIACSDGDTKVPPKFYRQAEEKLGRVQAKRDARVKGSKPRRKLNARIAKLHQRIARQRKQWHFETAQELIDKAEVIFVEDLKVSNMTRRNHPKQAEDGTFLPNGQSAKSGLNKSFADAGIAGFLNSILPFKAANAGKKVVKVNPGGTSQHCAICLNRVPKGLSDRWHECLHCGASMPRDVNSGVLIQKVGLGEDMIPHHIRGVASLKNAKPRSQRSGPRSPRRTA
jgi:putative transposase